MRRLNEIRLIISSTLVLVAAFAACNTSSTRRQPGYTPADTATSFRIGASWATPKKSFDFNTLGQSSGDTLHLVTCSDYVYFPFGKLTDTSSLRTSLLKDFAITAFERDTFTNKNLTSPLFEWTESMVLQLGDNHLDLFLDNDPEASTHGYIRGGEIADDKVVFLDNIKVGMQIEDFYRKFFDYFPPELNNTFSVVAFEACVTDITHIYTFKNGRLKSVKFISQ